MSIKKFTAPELLSFNKFIVDEDAPHIEIDQEICQKCDGKPCLYACPAVLYTLEKAGTVSFDYAGCLECGTCRVVCKDKGIVKWTYPWGTFGVAFRFG